MTLFEANKKSTATGYLEKEQCSEKIKSIEPFLEKWGIWRRVEVDRQGNGKYVRRLGRR